MGKIENLKFMTTKRIYLKDLHRIFLVNGSRSTSGSGFTING